MMRPCDQAGVPLTADASDKTALVLPLPAPAKPGADKVNWRAMSADRHEVKDNFAFPVRP